MPVDFDYSGLSPEHQAKLRGIVDHIHVLGCQDTATAVGTGNSFIEASDGLDPGQFVKFCGEAVGYSYRKVQLLMNLARFADKEPDVLRIPVSAGYLISAPGADKQIVQQVLALARDGGRVKVNWVEKLLKGKDEEKAKSEPRSTSEASRIAKLIAGALDPGEARSLRKLLEVAGTPLIQQVVAELQDRLRSNLNSVVSSNQGPLRPGITS